MTYLVHRKPSKGYADISDTMQKVDKKSHVNFKLH